jgi:hypothetical protein
MGAPEMVRAITRRWICLAPSKMVQICDMHYEDSYEEAKKWRL